MCRGRIVEFPRWKIPAREQEKFVSEFLRKRYVIHVHAPPHANHCLGQPLFGRAAIGFSPIFVRLAHVAPEVSAFYRVALAVPLLWLWMYLQDRGSDAKPLDWTTRLALLGAGLLFSCDLGFWHWSITLTSVANATLLANFSPVFVTLGAVLVLGQRIKRLYLGGLITAIVGLVILMGGDLEHGGTAKAKKTWFETFLALPNGIPSHDTFNL